MIHPFKNTPVIGSDTGALFSKNPKVFAIHFTTSTSAYDLAHMLGDK